MDQASLTQSPFAVLTFIAAPALLTNSSSVLALSTINRMLRTRDRMTELFVQSEKGTLPESEKEWLMQQVDRVERRGFSCWPDCGQFMWRSARSRARRW